MKKRLMIILVLVLPMLVLWGNAQEPEFDGYVFRIEDSDNAGLFSLCDTEDDLALQLAESPEIAAVIPEHGIYAADSIADIYANVPKDKIVYIEPNYYLELFDAEAAAGWERSYINADAATDCGLTGSGVRIGIIDSGLDTDHIAFKGASIIEGENFIGSSTVSSTSTEKDTDVSDSYGHGTFIAGILVAQPGNSTGVVGLVPEAEIVPLRAFSKTTGTQADVANAIYAAVDTYKCDIINLSFGGTAVVETLRDAVAYAVSKGVVLVAAVGNAAKSGNPTKYPAAYDGVIGVGAYNCNGTVCSFSEYNTTVDLSAPGEDITGIKTGGGVKVWDGTSFSTPIVAAMAAIAIQGKLECGASREDLTSDSVFEILRSAAVDMGSEGYDIYFGWGTVKVDELIRVLEYDRAFSYSVALNDEGYSVLTAKGKLEIPDNGIYIIAAEYSPQNKLLSANILYSSTASGESVQIAKTLTSKVTGATWKLITTDSKLSPIIIDAAA